MPIGWDAYDTCSKCSYTTYNEIAALGHNYSSQVTKPTCTEQGYTTHTCTRCSDSYKDNYVNATGHTAATDNAVLPTCTTTGLTEGSHCSVCNEVLVAQTEVAASGHNWSEYVSNNDATLSADGTKTRTCKNDSTHKETVTDVGTQKIQVIDNTPSGETTPNVSIKTEEGFNPNIVVEVKVEVVAGKVDEGSSLTIDYNTQIAKNETLNGVYDVKLLLNGNEIPVSYLGQNATITVKILVPSELVGKTFRIIHVHDASDISEIKLGEEAGIGTYIIENGYLVTKIDRLSEFAFIEVHEGLSVGAIIGIVCALLLGLLLLIYILGYFFLYRRGRLDDSAIRIIYKWLPRGDKNKNDPKDNTDELNK